MRRGYNQNESFDFGGHFRLKCPESKPSSDRRLDHGCLRVAGILSTLVISLVRQFINAFWSSTHGSMEAGIMLSIYS